MHDDNTAYALYQLLTAVTSVQDDLAASTRNQILVDLAIIAHHPLVASLTGVYSWVTLIQRISVDPGRLVAEFALDIKDKITQKLAMTNQVSPVRVMSLALP